MAKISAFAICTLLMAAPAHADPPSSILQAVMITDSSGTVFSGFTAYKSGDLYRVNREKNKGRRSEEWVNYPPTPEDIRRFLLGAFQLSFYETISKVAYPREMIVTTKPVRKFRQGEIKEIVLSTHPLNGHTWYGLVNEVSAATVKSLQTKPVHSCGERRDGCCTHYFWLSYNKKVREQELKPFCDGPFDPEFERRASEFLKTPGIIRVGESTD